MQSHLVVIDVTSLTALDQIDAKNMGMSPDNIIIAFSKEIYSSLCRNDGQR